MPDEKSDTVKLPVTGQSPEITVTIVGKMSSYYMIFYAQQPIVIPIFFQYCAVKASGMNIRYCEASIKVIISSDNKNWYFLYITRHPSTLMKKYRANIGHFR